MGGVGAANTSGVAADGRSSRRGARVGGSLSLAGLKL